MPLALCDVKSVDQVDCIAVDLDKSDSSVGKIYELQYNENQRFYYLSEQRPDEVWLLYMAEWNPACPDKQFQGISLSYDYFYRVLNIIGVPHAAFSLPPCADCPHPHRESIEVRALIIV